MSTATHSAAGRALDAYRVLIALVTLPAAVAHEATHAALSLPWAEQCAVVIQPGGLDAHVGVEWREDTPTWAVVLCHFGPAIVGGLLGCVGLWKLATGGLPDSAMEQVTTGTLAVWWTIYMWPSGDDRQFEQADE